MNSNRHRELHYLRYLVELDERNYDRALEELILVLYIDLAGGSPRRPYSLRDSVATRMHDLADCYNFGSVTRALSRAEDIPAWFTEEKFRLIVDRIVENGDIMIGELFDILGS